METRTLKSKIGIYMLLSVLAVLVVIPFGWMLLASVKTSNEVFSIPMKLFPKEFQWVNYQTIWDKIPLLADGSHVMWIIGYRISEYYKIGPDTVRVLQAEAGQTGERKE